MERLRPSVAFEEGFRAVALLMKDEFKAAERQLSLVKSRTANAINGEGRNVHHVCSSIIHFIDGNRRAHAESVDAALKIDVRPIVRDWLPAKKQFIPFLRRRRI